MLSSPPLEPHHRCAHDQGIIDALREELDAVTRERDAFQRLYAAAVLREARHDADCCCQDCVG